MPKLQKDAPAFIMNAVYDLSPAGDVLTQITIPGVLTYPLPIAEIWVASEMIRPAELLWR